MYADGSISRPQYDVIPDLQKKIIKSFLTINILGVKSNKENILEQKYFDDLTES